MLNNVFIIIEKIQKDCWALSVIVDWKVNTINCNVGDREDVLSTNKNNNNFANWFITTSKRLKIKRKIVLSTIQSNDQEIKLRKFERIRTRLFRLKLENNY